VRLDGEPQGGAGEIGLGDEPSRVVADDVPALPRWQPRDGDAALDEPLEPRVGDAATDLSSIEEPQDDARATLTRPVQPFRCQPKPIQVRPSPLEVVEDPNRLVRADPSNTTRSCFGR
jgi:hypothetical protein